MQVITWDNLGTKHDKGAQGMSNAENEYPINRGNLCNHS